MQLAAAIRAVLRAGYGREDLRADVLAGCVVGIVALPLSMALAIASGVPPQHGLYTAIVAGALIALLGGSTHQVSGPTASVVILAPIAAKFGLGGLLLATVMAGLMLVAMGVARLGRLLQFVPHPVTSGFAAGIGTVIATLQLKDFFGLQTGPMPDGYVGKVVALVRAAPTFHAADLAMGGLALAILVAWPRVSSRVPGALVALIVTAGLGLVLTRLWPGFSVATIDSRFVDAATGRHGIQTLPPMPLWPWRLPGPDGAPIGLSFELVAQLIHPALAIAMLNSIESLLSAVVADGMTGGKHDPSGELVAQGIGNIVAPFFGGIAATGALARTTTNVRAGARSPIAAFIHSVFVLLAVLVLAPLLGHLPMAALAALLLVVAWNMSDVRHFVYMLRVAPHGDVVVLLTCFGLTVVFDMVVAVTVGVVLAALLFMRRMAEVSDVRLVGENHPQLTQPLPPGVLLYEVAGPLFFGAAQRAMGALHRIGAGVRIVVLDLRSVPSMDATGLANLESTMQRLHGGKIFVILAGVQKQPWFVMQRAGWHDIEGRLALRQSFDEAVALARGDGPPSPSPEVSRVG